MWRGCDGGGVLYEQSPFPSPFLLPAIFLLLTLTAALTSPIIYFQWTISPADANHGDLEIIKRYIFSPFAHDGDVDVDVGDLVGPAAVAWKLKARGPRNWKC